MTQHLRRQISDFESKLTTLDKTDLVAIESSAAVLSLEDCFGLIMVLQEDLTPEEIKICKLVYTRGKVAKLNEASNNLIQSMKRNGGGQIALEYIRSQSKHFSKEEAENKGDALATATPGGFTFNVHMPED